jgi:hypothetical protein
VVDVRPEPEPEAEADERPRQIVNLTAMRLMPAAPEEPVEAPAPPQQSPQQPPAAAPVAPAAAAPPQGRHAAAPSAPPSPPRLPPPPSGPPPAAAPDGRPVPQQAPAPAPTAAQPVATQRRPDGAARATWRVTFDTGETFLVEGLALVGRRPEARANEPVRHLVPLRSTDMSLSKTHAQFQVVPDGALVVMDRGSTNGSVVIRKGVSKPLTAGRPSTLIDGDTVRFGDRSMQVTREG